MPETTELASRLESIALDHRWTWDHERRELLESLPGSAAGKHPAAVVSALERSDLEELLRDREFVDRLGTLDVVDDWVDTEIAYFSPEFGLTELIPQYSGGLGILAGDHLKAANDSGLGIAGVGLRYRDGYFKQRLVDGVQTESYELVEPGAHGFVDTGLTVDLPMADTTVRARVWRLRVGRVPLLALDTDVADNDASARRITDRLYGGDRLKRIRQEMVLGVGGARALRAMGLTPRLYHLNEGHAGFMLLELLAAHVDGGGTFEDAIESVRSRVVFTTHTPVPAGIDRFDRDLATEHLAPWAKRLGVDTDQLIELGFHPDDGPDAPFNMAAFCLRLAGQTNGVSRLHGEVSRELFAAVPGGDQIVSVTNGVHARTWVSPRLADRFDTTLGHGWAVGDPDAWAKVEALDDEYLTAMRRDGRRDLIEEVERRLGQTTLLDPDVLTVGFARRFATYKRAALVLEEPERFRALLEDDARPIQFVFAGKAHPADEPGKRQLARIGAFAANPASRGRFVLVPGYDMALARLLYAGCDVWLNNPVRPQEACGTSGEKAALNGALNCSVSDGWWDEMYDGANGWVIPSSEAVDAPARDAEEAAAIHDLFEKAIVPSFYADSSTGPSPRWWARVRAAWLSLGPQVNAARMLREYCHDLYHVDAPSPFGEDFA